MNYLTDPINNLYRKLIPSAIGSMLTATVTSLIDTVILSHYLGAVMLSSVSICMPVYMIVNALSMLLASGGTTLCATYIGMNDKEESNRFFTVSLAGIVSVGLMLTVIGSLFTAPIIKMLGANEAIWEPTMDYARVLMMFLLPFFIYCMQLFFVRFDSEPGLALASTFVCAGLNLILDVLFVGPLNMGAKGAALATCLAYTAAAAVGCTHFLKKKNTLKLVKGSITFKRIKRILGAGLPLSLSQFGMALTTSVFNVQIMRIAGEFYVTVYAIITQLSMTALALYEGVSQAAQPILAANYGAGDTERIKKAVRTGIILELFFTGICLVVYMLFAKTICGFFSITEGELLNIGVNGIRIYSLSIPLIGINSFGIYFLQSRERVFPATSVSVLNGTLLMIAGLLVLTEIFGVKGIWWSWLCAQVLTLPITFLLYKKEK